MELTFVRTYHAPRQLVWDAWTDPDQLAQWWGPRGITTPRESIQLDLRPGGRIAFDMVDDATGARYPNSGTFLEVEPPARLIWSDDGFPDGSGTFLEVEPPARLTWSDDGFPDGSGKGTAIVTFTEVDASTTTLTVHLDADFSETVRAGAELGWGTQLDKLVEHLAALQA